MNTERVFEIVNEKGIWKRAHYLSARFGVDVEDARGDIVLKLLEIAITEWEKFEQGGAFALNRATWLVMNDYIAERAHARPVLDFNAQAEQNGVDVEDYIEVRACHTARKDFHFSINDKMFVRMTLEGLTDRNLITCANLLSKGYKRPEIAQKMGVSAVMVVVRGEVVVLK